MPIGASRAQPYAGRSAAGGMLAVAAQLDAVARLLTVVAAILTVGTVRRDYTLATRMRALRSGFSHNAPLRQHSTPIRHSAAIRLSCAGLVAIWAAGAGEASPQADFSETLTRV